MAATIAYLSSQAAILNRDSFYSLFYAGFNLDPDDPWPYLPDGFDPPDWDDSTYSWIPRFLLH